MWHDRWGEQLPLLLDFVDSRMKPRLKLVTSIDRRFQMLISLELSAKMPALASRIPADIKRDIEATCEVERAGRREVFPV